MLAIVAAVLLAAAPRYDTVFTADGGRVLGTVIEEGAASIAVQLADGSTRHYAPREVLRIEYADGSVSSPAQAPPSAYQPPPPAYQPPPPAHSPPPPPPRHPGPRHAAPYAAPAYAPAPYEPPAHAPRLGMPPISPVYGALGLGGAFISGKVVDGLSTSKVYEPQLDVWLEGGLRLSPEIALGLYLDLGVGDPAEEIRAECEGLGMDCVATTGRLGVLLRHTFDPAARTSPWVAAGTAFEFGSVHDDSDGSSELFTYGGWEVLRLMGGVDFRSNPLLGMGLYGALAFGTYSHYEDAAGEVSLGDQPFHTTVEVGLRFTLFP